MYFDTSYVAKFYLNEPGSQEIRALARQVTSIKSSEWTIVEFHSVLHRKIREGSLAVEDAWSISLQFAAHVDSDYWTLIPVRNDLLRLTGRSLVGAPPDLFLRAGDAVHLITASESRETEIWTNDRHMIAAAPYFGLTGRSVY